jgi:hypothetical protein
MKRIIFIIFFFSSLVSFSQETVYMIAETMPEFPGGLDSIHEYLANNIDEKFEIKPSDGEWGSTIVMLTISKDSTVTNVKIRLQGFEDPKGEITEEINRLFLEMPKWIPGTMDGKNVNVYTNISFMIRYRPR